MNVVSFLFLWKKTLSMEWTSVFCSAMQNEISLSLYMDRFFIFYRYPMR